MYPQSSNAQPVKADERASNMLRSSDSEDEPCSSVLNRLESRDEVGRKSKQNAVTIFQSKKAECNNKRYAAMETIIINPHCKIQRKVPYPKSNHWKYLNL